MSEKGFYKGEPASPHTVKFKTEYCGIPINIDRPKGFIMKGTDEKGRDWARRYRYDYGFIPKTLGGDGDGLDVFIGPKKTGCPDAYWAIQRKPDGTFDEYKVFVGFENRDAAIAAYRQHIPKKFFQGMITLKTEMMKAMLGKVDPDHIIKRASALAFVDELGWLMKTSKPRWMKELASAGHRVANAAAERTPYHNIPKVRAKAYQRADKILSQVSKQGKKGFGPGTAGQTQVRKAKELVKDTPGSKAWEFGK